MDGFERRNGEIHRTEAELENGLFGSFVKTMLEKEALMFPFYQGEPLPLNKNSGGQSLYLYYAYIFNRPTIVYSGTLGDGKGDFLSVETTLYAPAMIDEANEKGASWLISQMDPTGLNVHNYIEHNQRDIEREESTLGRIEKRNTLFNEPERTEEEWIEYAAEVEQNIIDLEKRTAYEKTYRLDGRDVLALVIDDSKREGKPPILQVSFVYDDIFVRVTGRPWIVENALQHLSFREICLPTALEIQDWWYEISNGEVTITTYWGDGGEVTIPPTIEGYPVTEIGDDAFLGASATSVIIPDSVTSIGVNAFVQSDLTSIIIPDSVTTIEVQAFSQCDSLTSVTIPYSVSYIGFGAFKGCENLTIYCFEDSIAHRYAEDNNIRFELIETAPNLNTASSWVHLGINLAYTKGFIPDGQFPCEQQRQ
jgi:hypothetical protein